MLKIYKPKRRNGTYYFRFSFDKKEVCNSLYTKEYSTAKTFIKELKGLLMSKKYTFEEVRKIFLEYVFNAKRLQTEDAFKCKDKRYETYFKNNTFGSVELGILTHLQSISDTLEKISSNQKLPTTKNLNQIKKEIKPLVPNIDEFLTERHGKLVFEAHKKVVESDVINHGLQTYPSYQNTPSIKEALKSYTLYKDGHGIKPLSRKQLFERLELMLNILSNYNFSRKIGSFSFYDFDRVQDIIRKYPANFSKYPEFRHMANSNDIMLILETTQEKNLPTLSLKTASEYIRELNQFLNYCVKRGILKKNYLNFEARDFESAETKKINYSSEDISEMLKSPRFTTNIKKTLEKNPENIWIPLIAMFSGMRLSEICQLHYRDINTDEKYFNLTAIDTEAGKSLKTKSSERRVPIHSFLLLPQPNTVNLTLHTLHLDEQKS